MVNDVPLPQGPSGQMNHCGWDSGEVRIFPLYSQDIGGLGQAVAPWSHRGEDSTTGQTELANEPSPLGLRGPLCGPAHRSAEEWEGADSLGHFKRIGAINRQGLSTELGSGFMQAEGVSTQAPLILERGCSLPPSSPPKDHPE